MTYAPADPDLPEDERPDGKRDRTARLLNVLAILQGSGDGGIRVEEIARRTGMSKRSAYRDVRALEQELKIPLWSEGGRWGVGKGAFLPPLQLTQPEATAVFLAARVITRYADKYDPNLASAFGKLAAALPDAIREHVERTLRDLALRPVDPAFNRHVEDLTRAWAQRRVVRFRYAPALYDGGDREPSWREVRPYLVEPSLQTHALYLIGHDETKGAMRTFKVERILDLSLTARTFEAPEAAVSDTLRRAWDIIADQPEVEVVLVLAVRLCPGPRGDMASEPVRHGGAGRVPGVAGQGVRDGGDPALDPCVGRRRGGAQAGGAACRGGRDARPGDGAVREGLTRPQGR